MSDLIKITSTNPELDTSPHWCLYYNQCNMKMHSLICVL